MCMDISQTSPPERCRQDSSRQGKGARSSVRWMESSGATRAPCTERARRSSARTLHLDDDPELKKAIRSSAKKYSSGICLRLVPHDLADIVALNKGIKTFVGWSGLPESDIDLRSEEQ